MYKFKNYLYKSIYYYKKMTGRCSLTNGRFNNWKVECEEFVNQQISLEYWASVQYHALASYFGHQNVGLDNISKFFNKRSLEEREHADKLVEYQNKRGGTVKINNITGINNTFYNSEIGSSNLLQAFKMALDMEQKVYKSLLHLHELGDIHKDPALADFIESEYLTEQIDAINELACYVSQLQLIGNDGAGLWMFNNEFSCE